MTDRLSLTSPRDTYMDYELAKKLKDAGFPQNDESGGFRIKSEGEQFCWCGTCQVEFYVESDLEESVCSPTLEELIEACGEYFMLTNECGVWEAWSDLGGRGLSMVRMGESGAEHECKGKTPSEAVANLWLSLHTK